MHIKKRYLFLFVLIVVAALFLFIKLNGKWSEEKETSQFNLSLQQLRGVTKLVVWEQDFMLNDIETIEKKYKFWFDSKESVSTTVHGKMGFHIDLSDSMHTRISHQKDTVYVDAPLQITYVSFDMSTLQQVKDRSLDPSINVDKEEIIKHLDQKALEQYLPTIISSLRTKSLTDQERQLSKLINKPVKITITKMPGVADWKR